MPTDSLEAVGDAWIDEADPDANYGDGVDLRVRSEASADRRALVQFDMDQLPADFHAFTSDVQADVVLTVDAPDDEEDRDVELVWLASGFNEAGVTWNTKPGDHPDGIGAGSETATTAGEELSWDHLGLVDQIPTSGLWPIYLRDAVEDADGLTAPHEVVLDSRETSTPPTFEFHYRAENDAEIDSQVTVRQHDHADLGADVVVRRSAAADLSSSVEPRFSAVFASTVEPATVAIDPHLARAVGRRVVTVPVSSGDLTAIVDEVGEDVVHDPAGIASEQWAIVQVVEDESEGLRPGDARLFAVTEPGTYEPGLEVASRDTRWRVVDVEEIQLAESLAYQEARLRRLSPVARARMAGTVRRRATAGLYSEVAVP